MAVDLSGARDGVPERFVPDQMRGQLIEAEHLVRYKWATAMISGGRVLDAGCGLAYGTSMLAQSGASEVIGVDIAAAVLDAVRAEMPANVRLEVGDIRDLPYGDGAFDAVVCFECIEHLADPGAALDELARVVGPDGLLLVSSPNREVNPPGNPHHQHEFLPQELATELGARFRNVRLVRQQDYIASVVLTDEALMSAQDEPLEGLHLFKTAPGAPDRETFTLALASDGSLPETQMIGMVTATLDLNEVFSFYQEQEDALQRHRQYIGDLEQRLEDHRELQMRLLEAEQETLGKTGLQDAQNQVRELTAQLEGTRRILEDVVSSPSWRLTAPIRALKERLNS